MLLNSGWDSLKEGMFLQSYGIRRPPLAHPIFTILVHQQEVIGEISQTALREQVQWLRTLLRLPLLTQNCGQNTSNIIQLEIVTGKPES